MRTLSVRSKEGRIYAYLENDVAILFAIRESFDYGRSIIFIRIATSWNAAGPVSSRPALDTHVRRSITRL